MPATISKEDILTRLCQLPSLPLIVQEVVASFKDASLDNALLANKIAKDHGLSARVLRVANSPFYGLPRKVGSIQDAIVVLGLDTVRSLVLSAGMAQTFPPSPGSLFDRQSYWRRCFRAAILSRALAKSFLRRQQPLAFTAGMFYDIGQMALEMRIPERFTALLQQQAASNLPLLEIEQSELGVDHAEIGAEMVRRWNFPPEIEHAIRYWRTPDREPFEPLTGIVYVAALLESGLGGDELMAQLPAVLRDRPEISWERMEACLPEPERLDAIASLMLEV